jgi:hypothetical protein
MRKASSIQHPNATQLYNYADGIRFDPGSAAETFLPEFANPVFCYRGAGRLAGALRPLQPAQVRFLPLAGLQGVGGVQAGFIISQPLLDPSQLENPAVD